MTVEDFRARWGGHRPGVQDITGEYAVLVPLVERPEGLCLLFEVRSGALRRQPGEVCFPGGKLEPGEDAAACALRETEEELGIPPERVTILGELDWLTHQGGFVMYPVLGVVDPEAPVIPSPAEVAEVFYVPVDHLRTHPPEVYTYDLVPQVGADFPYEKVGFPRGYPWRGGKAVVPIYPWGERAIWGLTGRIVRHLLEETP